MSVEQLKEALKDESGNALYELWLSGSRQCLHPWERFRNDVAALLAEKEQEKPKLRPLIIDDWAKPDFLQRVVRRDGKPHDIIRVLCTDAPGDQPVLTMDGNAYVIYFRIDGRYAASGSDCHMDLLLPITEKRTVRYCHAETSATDYGYSTPRGPCGKRITIIEEE